MNRLDFDIPSLPAAPIRRAGHRALACGGKRRGQALILAVLIMLMIALISAGFLVVVSGNLSQTARVGDKSRAVEAARSGLRFVNERLTYSPRGENWRPGFKTTGVATTDDQLRAEGEVLLPQLGDASYNLFYTAVDRAQGWAGTFAKFPDPLAPRTNAPTFLARVQRIPGELDAGDPDTSDASKQGALKITVIGLSPDDPAAFHKTIAYKGGQAAPLGRVMRTVTNWDFKNKVVPSGEVASFTGTTLTLQNISGTFPATPFTVMIGNAQASQPLRGAVVTGVSGSVLTLAVAPTNAPVAGERVEVAAQLGASKPLNVTTNTDLTAVDFDLSGTIDPTTEKTALSISDAAQPGSVFVNGSALMVGNINTEALEGRADATHTRSNVQVTGLVAQDASVTTPTVKVAGTDASGNAVAQTLSSLSSNDANFPFGAPATSNDNSLVSDGFNRLSNAGGDIRQNAPAPPPDISKGAGAARYRDLAREDGTLINNPTDRERVYDSGKLRDMTQTELVKMWLSRQADGSDDNSVDYYRSGAPAAPSATNASLEQQHLRGWVGPDEFHARGALVELFNDAADGNKPKVAITLDGRSDNSSAGPNNAFGPVDAKAWRDASGAVQSGVYRRVFAWPANGVIFAEGNVRVRGELLPPSATTPVVPAPPSSLTVVSENNIYIDGALGLGMPPGAGAKKVLLLARKNVVANPTALVSRVEGASLLANAASGTSIQVSDDGGLFQKGDWLSFDATPTAPPCEVANVAGGALTLNSAAPSVAAGTVVRAVADPLSADRTYAKLSGLGDIVQRRFPSATSNGLRLAFLHSAEQRAALGVGFSGGSPSAANLTAKKAVAATDVVANAAQKLVSVKQDAATPDTFDLKTATTLTAFATNANSQTPQGAPVWNYQFTAQNSYDGIAPIALAGVGNRYALGAPTGTSPAAQNVLGGGANDKTLFVATSVTANVGGVAGAAPLTTDHWGSAPQTVSAFGFAPDPTADEDILTGDASFYVPDAAAGTPQPFALDSRTVPVALGQTFSLTLGRNADGTPLAGFAADPAAANHLPFYRLGALKLENLTPDPSGANNFVGVQPVTMDIHAFVYAQTGSWFVIPAPRFDSAARNGDDADRNGAADGSDAVNAFRFGRYNYKVAFTGAIAENQTALVNAAGAVPGAVQIWSDSWANVSTDASTATERNAGVVYTFDPDYATGVLLGDAGFVMPQSDELTYVE